MTKEDLMTRKQVMDVLGISDKTLYRWVKEGRIMAPMKINAHTHFWYAGDIAAYKVDMKNIEDLKKGIF